ncbi:MAG: sugar phosphate isomerase/epimerase [Clostridia bacterium]|nr:sugar phosphate isomerase/epimerase [Clostridia bacterium]
MKTGLAIWHYPHRSVLENVRFFAAHGLQSVSLLGTDMAALCRDSTLAAALAEAVRSADLTLTVHHILPRSHSQEDVQTFREQMELIADWQRTYGLLHVYSFDVAQPIRDNILPYLNEVLSRVPGCRVAVEDFGLNAAERAQLESLRGNPRFGYLVDIGHMFLRLTGRNDSGKTLFTHTDDEGPVCDAPDCQAFLRALKARDFPVFEIHLHNNDGVQDMHYFLGDGALDVQGVLRAIKAFGFDGVMTIESAPGFMFECVYPESDRRILDTIGYYHRLWEQA